MENTGMPYLQTVFQEVVIPTILCVLKRDAVVASLLLAKGTLLNLVDEPYLKFTANVICGTKEREVMW